MAEYPGRHFVDGPMNDPRSARPQAAYTNRPMVAHDWAIAGEPILGPSTAGGPTPGPSTSRQPTPGPTIARDPTPGPSASQRSLLLYTLGWVRHGPMPPDETPPSSPDPSDEEFPDPATVTGAELADMSRFKFQQFMNKHPRDQDRLKRMRTKQLKRRQAALYRRRRREKMIKLEREHAKLKKRLSHANQLLKSKERSIAWLLARYHSECRGRRGAGK